MKITSISVRVGQTVSMGQYNSARLDVTLAAELDKDDDPTECFEELYSDARKKLTRKIETLIQ